MKRLMLLLLLTATVACGSSPVAPGPGLPPNQPPPNPNATVRLSMHIYGHISQKPLAGLATELVVPFATGNPVPNTTKQVTAADGTVAWLVEPGKPYALTIDGVRYFGDVVNADVQWSLSLPR